jgi:hypothetical protein
MLHAHDAVGFCRRPQLGLMALNAVSAGASFAMTSLLLAPPLDEQIDHAANRDDCPCPNGQEPCLSAPHFAFPRIAPSKCARAWLKFATLNSATFCGATACARTGGDFNGLPA